jgi:hypothetical protein
MLKSQIRSVVMDNSDKVGKVFSQVLHKGSAVNPKKYTILAHNEDGLSTRNVPGGDEFDSEDDEAMRTIREMELEENMIDPDTIVRNLKTNRIELREKIFLDKKISK